MKNLISLVLLLAAFNAHAEIITLKDGTRLEGTVEGEMDGMKLIKTKYGSLNINKDDILNIGVPDPHSAHSGHALERIIYVGG